MPRPGSLPDQRPDLSGRPIRHHLVLTKRGERTSSKEVAPLISWSVLPREVTLRNLLSPVASSQGWRPHHHGGQLAH